MAKKGGLGTGVDTLLKGSSRQRNRQRQQSSAATEQQMQPVSDTAVAPKATEAANSAHTIERTNVDIDANAAVAPTAVAASADANNNGGEAGDQLLQLSLEQIRPGSYQPRRSFDQTALQELADSLLAQGLVQPILVRPYGGRYELIAGERRWRAAKLAGLETIPAIVRQLDDQSVAAVSLIENIQRKDLNALEEAHALQRLRDEFGMTQEAVAKAVGRSRSAVTNLLRLLELHEEVKTLLEKGELDMGHARALLALDREVQPVVARQVIARGLSVRATESLIRERLTGSDKPSSNRKMTRVEKDPDVLSLERRLGDTLGASVAINQTAAVGGTVEISYNSLDELDGILAHIK